MNIDWTSIICAILALAGTCVGTIYGISKSNDKANEIMAVKLKVVEDKIDKLEKEVKITTQVQERVSLLEKDVSGINTSMEKLWDLVNRLLSERSNKDER